jgi:cis-3-alkyl-4-acyloxetan-2-one decarboxylase
VLESWRDLYPFSGQEIRVGGLRYHYVDEGRGKPLLFVHGNPTWSFYWRELIKAFRGSYRAIAPDHIGCGLSEKPHAAAYSFRLSQRIDDLLTLVRHLDLREVTLLAHDWGGAIGLGAAVAEPDRFSRIVLFNTAAFRSSWMPWRIRVCRTPLLGRLGVQGLNGFARAALAMATALPGGLAPAVRAGLVAPYDNWRHREAIYRFVQDIPMRPAHPSYATLQHIENGLSQFSQRPICLIWGMRDWCFTPYFLRRFQEFFPHAETHELASAGHYVVEDAAQEIIPIVKQFLERAPQPYGP